MHSRIGIQVSGLVVVTVLLSAGCQEPLAQQSPQLRTGWKNGGGLTYQSVSIGGKPPVGPVEASDSTWQDEAHWLLLCVANYPGKPKGPVALVIARVRPDPHETRNVSDRENIFTIQTNLGLHQPGTAVVWALRKDFSESMHVGGKEYDLNEGRVFLVDVAGPAISAHQINADLGGTFGAPGPDYEKLGTELESLLEKDVKVKRFWRGDHPDAEDF